MAVIAWYCRLFVDGFRLYYLYYISGALCHIFMEIEADFKTDIVMYIVMATPLKKGYM